MIALVADRDITKNGIEVNYGPGKASFPVGPAAIAVALDGLVLPLSSHYNQEGVLVMHFFPALSPSGEDTKEKRVQTMTQELAHSFEKEIKNNLNLIGKLSGVFDADSMTENQMVAWVKDFYKK